jgi:hypothetical protein
VSVARFRITARDGAGRFNGATEATVEVNRNAGTITIRPLRQREVYTLPLATVAEMIIWRCMRGDAK